MNELTDTPHRQVDGAHDAKRCPARECVERHHDAHRFALRAFALEAALRARRDGFADTEAEAVAALAWLEATESEAA